MSIPGDKPDLRTYVLPTALKSVARLPSWIFPAGDWGCLSVLGRLNLLFYQCLKIFIDDWQEIDR